METIRVSTAAERARVRRFALGAQGLLQRQPFGRGLPGARKAIAHLGYVQIDTISVVERAHHHVLRSRVPNFTPKMTDALLKNRSVFEYWSHAAALLPMADFRFTLRYKHMFKTGTAHWMRSRDKKLMGSLKRRIASEGPLRSRDIEQRRGKSDGWWDWKPAKKALEQLFMQGDLMVTAREGVEKTYDLTENVMPEDIDTRAPSVTELADYLIDQQLRCHGLVTAKGMTYLRRDAELRTAAVENIKARLADGQLETLALPGGELFYARAGLWDSTAPRAPRELSILSPFDNAVIQRERLSSLFDFDYQIECYVPGKKRLYGYFCLPLVYRDLFIGRVDCKAHRAQRRLELKALHFEEHPFGDDDTIDALVKTLPSFAKFQGCDQIEVTRVEPRRLRRPLERALRG